MTGLVAVIHRTAAYAGFFIAVFMRPLAVCAGDGRLFPDRPPTLTPLATLSPANPNGE